MGRTPERNDAGAPRRTLPESLVWRRGWWGRKGAMGEQWPGGPRLQAAEYRLGPLVLVCLGLPPVQLGKSPDEALELFPGVPRVERGRQM